MTELVENMADNELQMAAAVQKMEKDMNKKQLNIAKLDREEAHGACPSIWPGSQPSQAGKSLLVQ